MTLNIIILNKVHKVRTQSKHNFGKREIARAPQNHNNHLFKMLTSGGIIFKISTKTPHEVK